jgi:hypothetical protein
LVCHVVRRGKIVGEVKKTGKKGANWHRRPFGAAVLNLAGNIKKMCKNF